jgi:hypothetical protein
MTKRGEKRAQAQAARWADAVRAAAHEDARNLALDIVRGNVAALTAYELGIVLLPDEVVWREAATADWVVRENDVWPNGAVTPRWDRYPPRPWLVTSHRIISRQPDTTIAQVQWATVTGCRADLIREFVQFDAGDWQGAVAGPGVAVIAVAALASVYGPQALIDHPALAPLRNTAWIQARRSAGTEASLPPGARPVDF